MSRRHPDRGGPPARERPDEPTRQSPSFRPLSNSNKHEPVTISRAFGLVIVTLNGTVDGGLTDFVRYLLVDLIEGQGNLNVLIDLRHVKAVDSSGLDVLIEAGHRMNRQGGTLRISEPPPELGTFLRPVSGRPIESLHPTQ